MFFARPNPDSVKPRKDSENWVYSLAGLLKDTKAWDDINKVFGTPVKFFHAIPGSEASKGNIKVSKTKARYYGGVLELDTFEICEPSLDGKRPKRVKLEDLPGLAAKLELFEINEGRWRPLVEIHVAETMGLPAKEAKRKAGKTVHRPLLQSGGIQVIRSWKSVIDFKGIIGKKIKRRLETPKTFAHWYFVSLAYDDFASWRDIIIHAAADKGVVVTWITMDFTHVKTNGAMARQWTYHFCKDRNSQKELEAAFSIGDRSRNGFRWLAQEIELENTKATITCVFTKIPLNFTGFFAVSQRCSIRIQDNLRGFGIVNPFGMDPQELARRSGFFLEESNPLLGAYIQSIGEFTNHAPMFFSNAGENELFSFHKRIMTELPNYRDPDSWGAD